MLCIRSSVSPEKTHPQDENEGDEVFANNLEVCLTLVSDKAIWKVA